MKLYPINVVRTQEQSQQITKFFEQDIERLPKNIAYYLIYRKFDIESGERDVILATEVPNHSEIAPIEIELEGNVFDIFHTKKDLRSQTWERIVNRAKQGLIKRVFILEVEKFNPDDSVEIYISTLDHC